jgi:hypothetical protein
MYTQSTTAFHDLYEELNCKHTQTLHSPNARVLGVEVNEFLLRK